MSNFSLYLNNFLEEGRRLSGRDLNISSGPRFINVGYADNNRRYTYARIDKETGEIYSQSGNTPRGNLFSQPYHGIDIIGQHGVIVNQNKLSAHSEQLRTAISFPQAEEMIRQGLINNFNIRPELQTGLSGGNTKVTLIDTNGGQYDVIAFYDGATNMIYRPQ